MSMSSLKSFARSQNIVTVLLLTLSTLHVHPQSPVRSADADVKDASLRQTPGLAPNKNLLFNGWGVTPAGEPVSISDMPLKLVISPDKKMVLAVSAGFKGTGLSLLDLKSRTLKQFIPL